MIFFSFNFPFTPIFFVLRPPPPTPRSYKFSNGPSLSLPLAAFHFDPQKPVIKDIIHPGVRIKGCFTYRFSHDRGILKKKKRKKRKEG